MSRNFFASCVLWLLTVNFFRCFVRSVPYISASRLWGQPLADHTYTCSSKKLGFRLRMYCEVCIFRYHTMYHTVLFKRPLYYGSYCILAVLTPKAVFWNEFLHIDCKIFDYSSRTTEKPTSTGSLLPLCDCLTDDVAFIPPFLLATMEPCPSSRISRPHKTYPTDFSSACKVFPKKNCLAPRN